MNLTIVLPTYNEAQNLPLMVRALFALPLRERLRILIVDDNSPDGTGRIADELAQAHPGTVTVLHRRHKEGLGPAYVAGFTQALADGADLILQMDCDFSHRPGDIPALLAAAEDADVVIGSRFCPGGGVDRAWGASRKLLSRFANSVYVRTTLGLPIHDATGGFRLWRREALLDIDPARRVTLSGYGFQVEMALLAHRLGRRIKEVPIYFPDRTRGDSKMSMTIMTEAALQVPRLRWRHRACTPSRPSSKSNDAPLLSWLPTVPRRSLMYFVLLLALAFILRMVAMGSVPLIPEEAYYWMYAEHPNLSYYDHPPMVAWVIGLGTAVFGDTQFGVRIVGNLLMLGASLLMYRFGRAWFSRAAGLVSALLLQVLPVYFGVGFIATMDSALLFFWMLCLVGVTVALRRNQTSGGAWGWYLAGFALGAALLSKYTGVFLAAGTVLTLIAHRPWRRHLLTIHPYLAFLLAAAMFSPVILWNAQHDWASFRFQFFNRFGSNPLNVETMLEFVGIQFLVATPFVLWLSAVIITRLVRRRRSLAPRWIIALSFSLPLLLVMAYKSLRHDINVNWTLPVFLSLLPAVSQMFIAQMRRLRGRTDVACRRWAQQLTRTATICVLINIGITAYLLVLQPRLQLIATFGPWEPLARLVEEYEDRLEDKTGREPLIVAHGKYRLASVLAFYRKSSEYDVDTADYTTSQWVFSGKGLAYRYWSRRADWRGYDCLYVVDDEDADILAETAGLFDLVEFVDDARLRALQYRIAVCRGFRPATETRLGG